jgi:threonine synthase
MSFVSHVECTICGHRHDAQRALSVCERCGQMLAVRYDLARVKAAVSPEALRGRPPGMYRFRELTPLDEGETPVTLGEGGTPLLELPRLARHFGLRHVWGKDEGQNPTGSFKARGLGMAITRARTLGAKGFIIPSAGNAGGAAAVYAARCGLPCAVIVPRGTPPAAVAEAAIGAAHVFTIEGSIATAGRVVARVAPGIGWCDLSTLKEPYRLEGKKTMGLELAEQLDWRLPDVIFYPTGGGTGLIGMWKAFDEMEHLGWIEPGRRPRFYACQSSGCAPIVNAFERGERFATAPATPHTIASGLRVPVAVGDFMILDAVRASGGRAVAADEASLAGLVRTASALEGVAFCPESAACLGALEHALATGEVSPEETVVVFNTGAAQKYVEVIGA